MSRSKKKRPERTRQPQPSSAPPETAPAAPAVPAIPAAGAPVAPLTWRARHPVAFYFLPVALVGLFYAFTTTSFYAASVSVPLRRANAAVAASLLNLLGQHVSTSGDTIASTRLSISIHHGCDAVEPVALFVAAVLAYPATRRARLIGVLAGSAVLLLCNIVRVVSLFLIGTYWKAMFDTAHAEVWQVVFIVLAAGLWVLWVRWSARGSAPLPAPVAG